MVVSSVSNNNCSCGWAESLKTFGYSALGVGAALIASPIPGDELIVAAIEAAVAAPEFLC